MPGGPMADQGCHGKLTCNRVVTGCHRLSQAVTAVTAVTGCHRLSHDITSVTGQTVQKRLQQGLLRAECVLKAVLFDPLAPTDTQL